MSTIDVPLALLVLGSMVGYLVAAWKARAIVGVRWLPHLAFLHLIGLRLVFAPLISLWSVSLEQSRNGADLWLSVTTVAWGFLNLAEYALLALMLYLIARRLPDGSRLTEGDSETEGGD